MKNSTFTSYGEKKLHSQSVRRGRELGFLRSHIENAFNKFISSAQEAEIYEFMKKWHIKKTLVVFLLLGVVGFLYFSGIGAKSIEWATSCLDITCGGF